ncbi:hypothetical protein N7528_009310 [Penicillium herquei]|nr:hypothetical protein N7528_009310 [Penicillium herquei]
MGQHSKEEPLALLLSEGASVNVKDTELCTYLHLALAEQLDADVKGSKQLVIVKALLRFGAKENINAIDEKGDTPLLLAITQGASETVKLLVENGADINKQVGNRVQPLLCAAKRGSTAIVRILLEGGADIKAPNVLGESALWEAVSNNNIRMTKLLLEKGANPNVRNYRGELVIFQALRTGSLINVKQSDTLGVFDLLLTSGANPNSTDFHGQTILIAAIHAGVYSIVEILLRHGADATGKLNVYGEAWNTPLSACMQARTSPAEIHNIRRLLKRYGAT